MGEFSNAYAVVGLALMISIGVMLVAMFGALAYYLNMKRKEIEFNLSRRRSEFQDVITANKTLLDLIRELIHNECVYTLIEYMLQRKPYPVIKMDEDITNISTRVYEALGKGIFADEDLQLTSEFIMRFITKETTTIFLTDITQYNQDMSLTS